MDKTKKQQSEKKQTYLEFLTDFNSKDPGENILKCCVLGVITGAVGVVAATGVGFVVGGSAAVAAFGLTGLSAMKFVGMMGVSGIMIGSVMELVSQLAPKEKRKNAPHLKSVMRQHTKNMQNTNVKQTEKTYAQDYYRPVTYENGQALNYTMSAQKMASINAARTVTKTVNQQVEKPIRSQSETRRNQPPSARGRKDFVR